MYVNPEREQLLSSLVTLGLTKLTALCHASNYYNKNMCEILYGGCKNVEVCRLAHSKLHIVDIADLKEAIAYFKEIIHELADTEQINGIDRFMLLSHIEELAKYYIIFIKEFTGDDVSDEEFVSALFATFLENLE